MAADAPKGQDERLQRSRKQKKRELVSRVRPFNSRVWATALQLAAIPASLTMRSASERQRRRSRRWFPKSDISKELLEPDVLANRTV